MAKAFEVNENGKIVFTKEELKAVLNGAWLDGYNCGKLCWWPPLITYSGNVPYCSFDIPLERRDNEQSIKDCRNCKHGHYNDHFGIDFCYNSNDCESWNKWEGKDESV